MEGGLEWGLEVELGEDGTIQRVGPQSGLPDPYVLTPAFVNAHSHLEYRGLQWLSDPVPTAPDAASEALLEGDVRDYFPWIRALTRLKGAQDLAQVAADTHRAAQENRATGVGLIGEHSDRPFAGAALRAAGIRGRIYQELISLGDGGDEAALEAAVTERARAQAEAFGGPVAPSPHAPWSVAVERLQAFGDSPEPCSIHVAETVYEDLLYRLGEGPLRAVVHRRWPEWTVPGLDTLDYLETLGLMRTGVQWVHGCALRPEDAPRLAQAGVTLAHCPRSNVRLQCPAAPVREWLDAGVRVGLGLDSPASGGPIDVFAEMRAALAVASGRGRPLGAEEVWAMATTLGAASLGWDGWSIQEGHRVPLLGIAVDGPCDLDDVIATGSPDRVEWIHDAA